MTNHEQQQQQQQHIVDIYCRALRHTFGLIDHYFLQIDDTEYHLGYYAKGNVLPAGTTKGAHHVVHKRLCDVCFSKIKSDYRLNEDKRLFTYYPMINCETLATGISVQSLAFLVLPFAIFTLVNGHVLLTIVLLLLAFSFYLFYSKYIYSRTVKFTCPHI